MPLPGTIADFWRLVFGLKSKSIVMLNHIDEEDEVSLIIAMLNQFSCALSLIINKMICC